MNRIDLIRNAVNNLNSKSEFNNLAKLDVNHNVWNDSNTFAKVHYGDVYTETMKFDNEWN